MLSENEPMSQHCSFRTGGLARYFFSPTSQCELSEFLKTNTKPILITGLGSNLLVRDCGFDGVVIQLNQLKKLRIKNKIIEAQAGVTLAKLSRFSGLHQCFGAQFLSTIPGSVGGSLAMNAGAFGSEIWDFVQNVSTINALGVVQCRAKSDFTIGYRQLHQKYQHEYFISATFCFNQHHNSQNIKTLLAERNQSQPIGLANCGSVFKNPPKQHAAALIEKSNLKGVCIGGACVSSKHANFIINQNNASSADIENLIKHIQQAVSARFKIDLEMELKIV